MSAPGTQTMAAPAVAERRARFDLRRDGPRLSLFLLGLLALDLVLWIALVRPARADLAALVTRKQDADLIQKQEAQALGKLEQIDAHVHEARAGIDTFYGELLGTKRERLVPFQEAVYGIGRDFQISPEKVSVVPSELENEGIESLSFNLPLVGGYENLRRFLSRLESLDQFAIVRGVTLSGSKEGGRALQLNVTVETYFNAPEMAAQRRAEQAREKALRGAGARNRGRR